MAKGKRSIDVDKNNAKQLPKFEVVPYDKRILFLPHCMRKDLIKEIKKFAQDLGYHVVVASGGSQVFKAIQKFKPKAIVGIACMREIYLAFIELDDIDLPYQSIELLSDGCKKTEASIEDAKKILSQIK